MKANAIRKGNVILYKGSPYKVMEFFHNTPGKGQAVVQTKLRNLLTGSQTDARFNSTEEVEEADVFILKAQYLYKDGDTYHFMNTSSYEQFSMNSETLGDAVYYLQEEMEIDVTTYNNDPIGVTLPPSVVLTIVETEPELKGATASGSPKPAKTNTGLTLSVPPFIKQGEKIIVNTDEGKYISRADS